MKGTSAKYFDPALLQDSLPTPKQTAVALRWTAVISMLAAFIFGTQGGYFVVFCMTLTLFGVFMFMLSNQIIKENDGGR